MVEQRKLLVVDADEVMRQSLQDFLKTEGYETSGASGIGDTIELLQTGTFSLVLVEMNLPDGTAFDLLDKAKRFFPHVIVIVLTATGTIDGAVRAIRSGASDYLTKPIIDDELRMAVDRALKQQKLVSENERLRSQLEKRYSLENIISHDYKMARIFDLVHAVANSDTTVLMSGPSGTGKSMLARAIHHHSDRNDGPFVEVSCGALPETLLESELFGHTKGSFTGAVANKDGKFLAANNGTIFLDEISSASPALQVKLLRVLEERKFEAVGSNKTIKVDVRVLLASNKDLLREVRENRFREDLYYRINVVNIELPPLHERVGDVQLLARYFLQQYGLRHKREKVGFTDDTIQYLERYNWPGNVRELENVIERAVLLSKGQLISAHDLPEHVRETEHWFGEDYKAKSLKSALAEPEKQIIRQALKANNFNRQATAKTLQINRTTLFKKMKQYGLYDEVEKLGLL